jgi:hypothetical protein
MNPDSRENGGRCRGQTTQATWKQESHGGSKQPDTLAASALKILCRAANLMRGRLRSGDGSQSTAPSPRTFEGGTTSQAAHWDALTVGPHSVHFASAGARRRPRSSNGKAVWGQIAGSDADRDAGGQPPGSHVGFGGQGHERRGREGALKVSGEKPEGVET